MTTQLQSSNFTAGINPPIISNVQITDSNWTVVSSQGEMAINSITGGNVIINGSGFVNGCVARLSTSYNIIPVVFVSSSVLRILVPPFTSSTSVSLFITNPDGGTAVSTNSFTILAPKLFVWGSPGNGGINQGALGLLNTIARSSPTQVGTESNWKFLSTGNYINAGIKLQGTLWAWGRNNVGQLGLNDTINRSSPVQIGTDTNWETVSTSYYHMLATKTTGTLWAWGRNSNSGELGLNNTINRSSPTQVGSDADWSAANSAVSTGASSTGPGNDPGSMAIKNNGTLWVWGSSSQGQLGLNSTVSRSSPTQVGAENNWRQVEHNVVTHAIKTDGTLWAWGSQVDGQLGLNVGVGSLSSPVQVGTDTNWSRLAVSNSGRHSLGIKTDGTLWAWGVNTSWGRLGLSSTVNRSSPTQVGTDTSWRLVTIGGGGGGVHGIKTDGTLWSWGASAAYILGLNTPGLRSSPTQVGVSTNWLFVSAGKYHSAALTRD